MTPERAMPQRLAKSAQFREEPVVFKLGVAGVELTGIMGLAAQGKHTGAGLHAKAVGCWTGVG